MQEVQQVKPQGRFDYVKYDDRATDLQAEFKTKVQDLEVLIHCIPMTSDQDRASGRSRATALTKLEEVYMWIGKAIRDDQVARNGSSDLQEQRCDS